MPISTHRVPFPFVSDVSERLRDELYRNFEDLSAHFGAAYSQFDALVRAYDPNNNFEQQTDDLSQNPPLFGSVWRAVAYVHDVLGVAHPHIGFLQGDGDDWINEDSAYAGDSFVDWFGIWNLTTPQIYERYGIAGGGPGIFAAGWDISGNISPGSVGGGAGLIGEIYAHEMPLVDSGYAATGYAYNGIDAISLDGGYLAVTSMDNGVEVYPMIAARNATIGGPSARGMMIFNCELTIENAGSTYDFSGVLMMVGGRINFTDVNSGNPSQTMNYLGDIIMMRNVDTHPVNHGASSFSNPQQITINMPNIQTGIIEILFPRGTAAASNRGIHLVLPSSGLEHLDLKGHFESVTMQSAVTERRAAKIDVQVNEPSTFYGPAHIDIRAGWLQTNTELSAGEHYVALRGSGIIGDISVNAPEAATPTATLLDIVGVDLFNLNVLLRNSTGSASTGPKGYAIDATSGPGIMRITSDVWPVASTNASATTLVYDHNILAGLTAHLADTADAHDASAISYAGGTGLASTDVEAALDELADERARSRKNGSGTVFERSQFNFIEGANVTLTMADDAINNEVDITIAASGGGGGGSVATDVIWDSLGDLAVGTGIDTASRLAVGTDTWVLTADSGTATGLKWAAPPGAGTGLTHPEAMVRASLRP